MMRKKIPNIDLMDLGGDIYRDKSQMDLELNRGKLNLKSLQRAAAWNGRMLNPRFQARAMFRCQKRLKRSISLLKKKEKSRKKDQEAEGLDITDIFDFGPEDEEVRGMIGGRTGKEQMEVYRKKSHKRWILLRPMSSCQAAQPSTIEVHQPQLQQAERSNVVNKETKQKKASSGGGKDASVPQQVVDYSEFNVPPGTLDFVRIPLNNVQTEPNMDGIQTGASISEWEWFEPEQIQLLRQQRLVLVDSRKL